MEQFITLRQFCLLKDPCDRKDMPPRDLNVGLGGHLPGCDRRGWSHGRDVVARYDLAKEMWERFGDDGPPVGTNVMLLTYRGEIKEFRGPYAPDPRFFALVGRDGGTSLVPVAVWWAYIVPTSHPFCTERRPYLRWEQATE